MSWFSKLKKGLSKTASLFSFQKVDAVSLELMEETLFKLITKKPRFNAKYSFKTWLYTIGRNVAIDYLRHNSKFSDSSFDDLENYIQDEYDLERLYIIE